MQTQKSRPGAGTAHDNARSNDSPIDRVLHRLDRVKRTAPDKWVALCPVHDDKRPSLSIREAEDHRVLLKCWSGCGAAEIVNALGLSLADLFPGDRYSVTNTGSMRKPFNWQDALKGVAHEITVAFLIVTAVSRGDELDAESLDRLALAEERIDDALRAAGGVQ